MNEWALTLGHCKFQLEARVMQYTLTAFKILIDHAKIFCLRRQRESKAWDRADHGGRKNLQFVVKPGDGEQKTFRGSI